ncbi:diguanylate cyclase domain-containing protein [Methylobacterium trifolii]|uniref:Diguanylate cyclase n=1 Tax=Methylobacterium trifolii TaxID=1003092 RepID=A0ABQ4TYJ5_9HYPH|nr:diguanylate cyclase [Methylobacterium trifolii]GJE59616.1 hypothetical protein MPOCJGCO_1713 [Methylobacterium trifolii]
MRTTSAEPDVASDTGIDRARDDLDDFLEDVRRAFGVRTASIRPLGHTDLGRTAGFGFSAASEATFRTQAVAVGGILVLPDTAGEIRPDDMAVAPTIRFYASHPLNLEPGRPFGILCLLDTRPRLLSAVESLRLAGMARTAAALIARQRDAATLARMRTELELKEALIREQAAALAHSRKIFERASAAARIGVWECALPDESLHWTDVVYDIFEFPRGSRVDRQRTLACYTAESRKTLSALRSRAIAERGGFELDAEITTATGRRRWIRLTATVECENGIPVRIFGMKQDITDEKNLSDRTRYLAEYDAMTGLANRSSFQNRLAQLGAGAPSGALMLIDLDGFKQINDTFGHAAGDACLQETGRRLAGICRETDLVARVGGDEFAVLLGGHFDRDDIEPLAGRVVGALRQVVERDGRTATIGASVGIAMAGGCTPEEVFNRADAALYAAKAAGRDTFRTYEPLVARARPLPLASG